MGLFKNLRETAAAMKAMATESNAAAATAEANLPLTILNPTPQAEVDRLWAGLGPARGVVVRASHPPQDGERANSMSVTVRVRSRLAAGALGDEVTLKIRTSWKVAALLDRGLEIPVLVDRTTGLVTEILTDALNAELASQFDESGKRRPGWTFDPFG